MRLCSLVGNIRLPLGKLIRLSNILSCTDWDMTYNYAKNRRGVPHTMLTHWFISTNNHTSGSNYLLRFLRCPRCPSNSRKLTSSLVTASSLSLSLAVRGRCTDVRLRHNRTTDRVLKPQSNYNVGDHCTHRS